jgi:hypothetical protein
MANYGNELVNNKNDHHILGIVSNHDNMEVGKDVVKIMVVFELSTSKLNQT